MSARVRIIQRVSPAERVRWVSDRLGFVHDEGSIEEHLATLAKTRLWLPDTDDVIPRPPMIFANFCAYAMRGLLHGMQKSMKTTILAHMAVCACGGQDLFGHFPIDRSRIGPVVLWSGEGGPHYALDRIDRVCSVYGIARKSLEMEIQTLTYFLNAPAFLYGLGEQISRLEPALVIIDPLYMYAPNGWDGRLLTSFDVKGFSALCEGMGAVPLIGHHDKRGDAVGLTKASGVGPSEWAGQWWHVERMAERTGKGPHQLRMSFGARGAGGGQWGFLLDDDTLEVTITETDDVAPSSRRKVTTYRMIKEVLPVVLDREMAVGDLLDQLSGAVEAAYGKDISPSSLRRKYLSLLLGDGEIRTVTQTDNEHTVTLGDQRSGLFDA